MFLSEEQVQKLIDGGKGITELTVKGTTLLVNEALNVFMLEAFLGILKFASVFVIFFLVKKFLDTMMQAEEDQKAKNRFKSMKLTALILSIVFFVYKSFPHVENIGKIMVAPNLFLMEKGYNIFKDNK